MSSQAVCAMQVKLELHLHTQCFRLFARTNWSGVSSIECQSLTSDRRQVRLTAAVHGSHWLRPRAFSRLLVAPVRSLVLIAVLLRPIRRTACGSCSTSCHQPWRCCCSATCHWLCPRPFPSLLVAPVRSLVLFAVLLLPIRRTVWGGSHITICNSCR